MSSNKMHSKVSKILTYLLSGGKRVRSHSELHHFMDQPSKDLGPRHRIFYHNLLFHPLAFAILSKNNKAEVFLVTVTHILQDQLSSALKHGRRKHRK